MTDRELDAWVAEKVMGLENNKDGPFYGGHNKGQIWAMNEVPVIDCPLYSSDISATWEIVDRLRSEGHDFVIASYKQSGHDHWYVKINAKPEMYYIAQGDNLSAPKAICEAALKAMGYHNLIGSSTSSLLRSNDQN